MAKETRKTTERAKKVETSQPSLDAITPEMFAQFQAYMAMQKEVAKVEEEKPVVFDKRWLRTVRDREVRLTSCYGRVIYKSKKTGEVFKWLETGDDQYFTVQELLDMDNQSHKFLRTPWLLIDDDEVVEALGLTEMYSYIKRSEDVEEFLKSPLEEIESICHKLSKGYKCKLATTVSTMIENQELRDVVVIRKMQELLDKDFYY